MEPPVWVEKTVRLSGRPFEKCREFAILASKLDARKVFRDRIHSTAGLGLTKDMIDFSDLIVSEEDSTGNYGKPYPERDGKTFYATFRFKMECKDIRDVNPFVKKQPYNRPGIIREFEKTDNYWEIQAVGYGYYESFEDIDSKNMIAREKATDSVCNVVITKVIELGISDEDIVDKIRWTIKTKKDGGGVYKVMGCGVETAYPMTLRINKEDATVTFIKKPIYDELL
jgi:hypothetical protein